MKRTFRKTIAMLALSALLVLTIGASAFAAPADLEADPNAGVLIVAVSEESPASLAGLVRGDIVLAMNDEILDSPQDLAEAIRSAEAGDSIVLTVLHGDELVDLEVTLGERGDGAFLGVTPFLEFGRFGGHLGQDFRRDAHPHADRFHHDHDDMHEEHGDMNGDDEDDDEGEMHEEAPEVIPAVIEAQVTSVMPASPAAVAGLQVGDRILSVNGEALADEMGLAELIGQYEPGDQISLEIVHTETDGDALREETIEVPVILGKNPQDAARPFLGIGFAVNTSDAPEIEAEEGAEAPAPRRDGRSYSMPFEIVVAEVVEDSPAAEAGLLEGDMIVAVNGEKLGPESDLAEVIGAFAPGDEITLEITRAETDGDAYREKTLELDVTLGENPEDAERPFLGIRYAPSMGFAPQPRNPQGREFPMPEDDEETIAPEMRVIVAEVAEESAAAEAGILAEDIILAFDGEPIDAPEALVDLVRSRAAGDEIVLTILREDEEMDVPVTLGEDEEGNARLGVMITATLGMNGDMDGMMPFGSMPGLFFGQPDEDGEFNFEIPPGLFEQLPDLFEEFGTPQPDEAL